MISVCDFGNYSIGFCVVFFAQSHGHLGIRVRVGAPYLWFAQKGDFAESPSDETVKTEVMNRSTCGTE